MDALSDAVKHPAHYIREGIEVINVIRAFFKGSEYYYELGNATKYLLRCDKKGNFVQDLQKAKESIDMVLRLEAAKQGNSLTEAEVKQAIKSASPRTWNNINDIPTGVMYVTRLGDHRTRCDYPIIAPELYNEKHSPFTEVL